MTPNGAIVASAFLIAGSVIARGLPGLAIMLSIVLVFSVVTCGRRTIKALMWSGGIVLPLAAFMAVVWIGIVGRAPEEISAGVPGSRAAAAGYVAAVCLRLFIIAFVIQAGLQRFSHLTPLQFMRRVSAPLKARKLVVLTLSLIETMLHATDRARTALIAAGVITRRLSVRNVRNGWVLVQTVWLTAITIVVGRVRDKWPAEGTLSLLDGALIDTAPRRFTTVDAGWAALAIASVAVSWGLR